MGPWATNQGKQSGEYMSSHSTTRISSTNYVAAITE